MWKLKVAECFCALVVGENAPLLVFILFFGVNYSIVLCDSG